MSQAPYTRSTPTGESFSFQVFSEAWELFKQDWQAFVVFGLSTIGIPIVGYLIYLIPYLQVILSNPDDIETAQILSVLPIMLLGLALLSLGGLFMTVGWLHMAYRKIDEGSISWKDGWSSISTLGGHLAVGFLMYVILFIGFICLYVPGLIATAALWLAIVIYADPERINRGVIDALKESWRLTKGSLLYSFLFYFVLVLIAQLGSYAVGFGIVVTAPIAALAAVLQKRRRDVFVYGQPSAPAAAPPPAVHP